ncbi:MAG: hypothetical protein ACL7BU_05800 [Candidatus Phlomobacter fragariae]
MGDNGVVGLTLPSGKTVKLESLKALQELAAGKTEIRSVEKRKKALEGKADASAIDEIEKLLKDKTDANSIKGIDVNYPVGAPIPWLQATARKGYLICDGEEFDKVKCLKLAQAYPSGRVP